MKTFYDVKFSKGRSFLAIATQEAKRREFIALLNKHSEDGTWIIYLVEEVPGKGLLIFRRSR